MAVTKIKSSPFPMEFTGNETLIAKVGADGKALAINELKKLEAASKTVIITDSYLFESGGNSAYQDTIRDVLLSLDANKIIHVSYQGPGERAVREYVKAALHAQGCLFEYKAAQIHDRYWLCLENGKAISMNSIGGLGKKTSAITTLEPEEVSDLLDELKIQGVISDAGK